MIKFPKFAVMALAALAFFATPAVAEDAPMEIAGAMTVDADGVIALFDEHPDLVVLDNRKETDFNAGHIEGAVRLIDTEITADSLSAVIPSKDTAVLMYCNGIKCGRAANAVEIARDLGYSKIYYYALGMAEWKDRALPVMTN
ncbi:MAG: rhodanese-like domain-containing protein [Alphaproteobacteria bacterium]|nr:rhodanese-like domain-containing protein [Alphaproteobacteria bacterium]